MEDESVSSLRNEIKTARRQMARSASLALASLIVLVFACLAWFVRNTQVSSTSSTVQAVGSTFELASIGEDAGIFEDKIPAEFAKTGTEWSISGKKGTQTELNNVIRWQLTDDSDIGNGSEGSGIRPGSFGKIQFYVVPKTEGKIRIKFNLNILPLKEDETGNVIQYDKDGEDAETFSTLQKLLNGHIMFSYVNDESGDNENATWIPCDTGDFEMKFSGKEPHLVTLNWKWSQSWSEISPEIQALLQKNPAYVFYPAESTSDSEDTLYNKADIFIGGEATWMLVQLSAQPY